ncbi:PREDICTED: polypeptide N-acetylgalactosaminyltransferase-like 6 [Aptenodytes forsteri]|nr:PREDICTED: polypeptide N-acetylgalactosaminyltransferase-like 6 [Aptenodytes forsteri]
MVASYHRVASIRTVQLLVAKTGHFDEKHLMGIGARDMITAEMPFELGKARNIFSVGLARKRQGPSRRVTLFLRSLVAGPSWAVSPRVRVRIRPGEDNQGETQPGMARQGHEDEEAACGSRPGSQAHGRAQFSSGSRSGAWKEHKTLPLGLGDGQLFTWTDGLKRKDWHDYESIQKDAMRSGKGEHGKPYPLTEEDHDDSAYRENGFNIFVSNNIALERSLPDIRHPNCKHKVYLEKLPNTSIIIPFHNEGWTSLLRTIHSIINRTPDSLIAEIILVDDFSDREHLKEKLEEYMVRFAKVRIVRTKKREGLIRTRLLGASLARGEVLTFLDSHCEVNVNWLPPLLNQIALNHKTIVCPMIDVIDHNHFGYEAQAGDAMRGAFDWEMYYKRIPIPPELQRADPSDPFESPVMAGGLFAVNRKWFWELGGYDPGLEIWGGEQYEISFKVWMCGGGMFDVPCSRVGHIYRKYVPYKVPSGTSLARNLKRVAETWMDEFAEYIYQRRPEYRHLSTGDISAQKELRKHLKCKDFKWFMAAVAWDVPKYYPPVEPPPAAWGEIRNVAANLCVDSKHGATGTELRLDTCVKDGSERTWSHEQLFTFGWREDIRPGEPLHTRKFCFDAISHSSPVTLYDCHGMKGNQHWSYRKDKTLFHPVSSSCIDCNPAEKKIFMNRCDPLSETQQWIFEHINMTVLEKFNSKASS